MQIDFLKNRQDAIPLIAKWYFDEWAYLAPDKTLADMQKDLEGYLNLDKIPLMLVAIEDNKVVGTVQLKFREMKIYPNKEHWLGGVYVEKSSRGKHVAEFMIAKLLEIAETLGVELLHLQTLYLDGGLYRRLGWEPIGQVNYRNQDVLVMQRKLL